MKVTFIQPPIEDFYTTPIRRQPLGLLYLAAVARSIGWQVTFIDGHSPKKKIIPIPSQFDYLQKHMHSDSKKYRFPFKHYYHFGTSYQELKKRISNTPSDIFAVSSLFTPYHQESEKIISLIKECHPNTPIVTGGGHASIHPSSMLEAGANFVIQGEGEKSFIELLKKIDLKNETQLPTNIIAPQAPTQLDEIPIPARDLLADRSLKMFKKKGTPILFSRGCPNGCAFCMTRHIFGTAYRTRSTNSLLAEIDHCVKNLGVSFFNFEDDNLFASQEKAAHLLQALISYQKEQQTKLDLAAMNGISLEQITVEMLPLLVEAGFQELNISLVTAGSSLQAKLGRPFNTTHFEKIAKHANKLGINVRGYFILGHPQQDKHEIEETIKFFKTTNIKAIPSVYYNPMEQKKERWKIQRSSAFANETDYLTRKDLLAYFNQIVFDY